MPEAGVAALSLRDALAGGAARLAAAGSDTPRLDAELLLACVLGVDRTRLVIDACAPLGSDARAHFASLLERRAAHEPVAYIVGRKDFRRLSLSVDRRVLIPRPETELLVDAGVSVRPGGSVVDVGTGSGAVALALKEERPDLNVVGVDVSPDALAVARENARALGLDVRFEQADLLDGVAGEFDAVLANLPYVAVGSVLPADVERYEPADALFAGADGLEALRRLVPMLSGAPFVALEVGFDQADAVADLLSGAGFAVSRLRDLAGVERVLVGRR